MSKIGQAVIDRLEDGEDIETLIEKGFDYDSTKDYEER